MKNAFKVFGTQSRWLLAAALAAAMSFSILSCGGGSFKLTGMPAASNGKYAVVYAVSLDGKVVLVGVQSVNKLAKSVTLPRVSNGSVTVPMWKVDKAGNMTRYSGNDTVSIIIVGINDSEKVDSAVPADILADMAGATTFMGSTKFSNGSAAKAWKEGLGGGLFGGQGLGDLFKGLK